MANTSRPFGFRPVKHINGSAYNGQFNVYSIGTGDGTAVFVGDAVKLAGDADSTYGSKPTVTLAAAGDAIVGIVVGFDVQRTALDITGQYRAASTARDVYVADSPDLVFEAEVSNGTPATADISLNANHAVGSPSTTTARSAATIDMGTKNTTATLTFKLLGFVPRPDNEIGASAKVLVKINNHQLGGSTGTAGV